MSEPGSRRGRAHDAEGAREAILNAAEEIFAKHGYDGARIDAIAEEAGYNKSLIFQYFDDKLGLYAAVLKRADREMTMLQVRVLTPMLEDETVAHDAYKLKALLETTVQAVFDYLLERPRLVRMFNWEMAEGWQSYAKIISQFQTDDTAQLEALFRTAREAGLLRPGFNTLIQLTLILQICLTHLAYIPLYEMLFPGEDFSSAAALARTRENIVRFVVAGMMVDPPETKP